MKKTNVLSFLQVSMLFLLLSSCNFDRHNAMVERLEALQRFNQADSVFTSDSAALELANYFDAHGDANERMLAHYLLGRAYTDMGEFPKALQAFHEAVEKGSDTNYYLLNRIHQNAGRLYYREYLPELALQEWKKAAYNAKMDKDSFGMIVCEEHRLEAYYQLGKKDSVIAIARRCGDRFREMGLYEDAAYASSILCWYDIEDNKLDSARRKLEVLRGYIDFEKDNAKHIGTFWNYYGTFYQKSGNTDSALICHRKVLHYSTGWQMGEVLGYKGLFQVYKQLGVSDSVSKYAQLYCEANDSSNLFRSANQISQMQAMYDYNRHLQTAADASERARRLTWATACLCGVLLLVLWAGVWLYRRVKASQRRRMADENRR
ncbi:MAG: tetratricopeptide repeat protein, partial [Prevotella sp.]|nr:tetratricopeptide repeat protein [Prevotella sp.]